MAKECYITTFDNPYDPSKDFNSWLMFDNEKGYNTCAYLDRISNITDDMTEKERDEENERAIDEIIRYDIFNMYKKITKSNDDNT